MAAKKITKAITESVVGSPTGGNNSTSTVAAASFDRALTVKQAYETNITTRRAINVTAENEGKAAIRLFSRRTGDLIESGDCFDLFRRPSKHMSGSRFITDLAKWYKITGEMAVLPLIPIGSTSPKALKLLDPTRLTAYPANCRSLDFVSEWYYNDGLAIDGMNPFYKIETGSLAFAKNFNPYSDLRGSSEAISMVNEISTNYYVQRYNISRFKNGVQGDIVFIFPKGTKKQVVEDHIQMWQEQHSIHNDHGFKVAGIIGNDVKIEQLGVGGKDGEFLKLDEQNAERIASGFGVPASVMGFYGKTRFDTIDAEIESWTEHSILPDLRNYGDFLQTQIVDRYFTSDSTKKSARHHMSKTARLMFERAMDEHSESDIIVLLDPDTLPIMAKLNKSKVTQAKELMGLGLSATEAFEYVGLDVPHNPLRDDIYVPSNMVNISKPQQDKVVADEIADKDATIKDLQSELEAPKSLNKDQKATIEAIKGFYRDFRAAAIAAHEAKNMVDKGVWISRAKEISPAFVIQVHKDYLSLREIQRAAGTKEQVKAYFNSVSKPSVVKSFLQENENGNG